MKYFILVLLWSIGIQYNALAQKKGKPNPIGIWQLTQLISENGATENVPISHIKIYNSDQNYTIITPTNNGYIIAHSGMFKFTDKEIFEKAIHNSKNFTVDKEFKKGMPYSLSFDAKELKLTYPINNPYDNNKETLVTEVWKRIDVIL
ncbi:DUF4488 domain-containing protein [Sphingobacterium sp. HJSM2_6]|uniref:DUF4488 domain-containing protein n=1 Tax=Sphingobacterium sp. HJSM2_6 TaxID=3366264 RepID=UPI003BD6184D